MSSTNNTNSNLYNTVYKSSETFSDYLSRLEKTINIVLDKLLNSYPNYKLYPDVTEVKNIYTNDNYNLSNIKTNLFSFEAYLNNLKKNLIKEINNNNEKLNNLKIENKSLKNKYNSMVNTDATSIGQQSEMKYKYQEAYVSLVLTILFLIIFIISSYKYLHITNENTSDKQVTKTKTK